MYKTSQVPIERIIAIPPGRIARMAFADNGDNLYDAFFSELDAGIYCYWLPIEKNDYKLHPNVEAALTSSQGNNLVIFEKLKTAIRLYQPKLYLQTFMLDLMLYKNNFETMDVEEILIKSTQALIELNPLENEKSFWNSQVSMSKKRSEPHSVSATINPTI